jgi:hypothetical protein
MDSRIYGGTGESNIEVGRRLKEARGDDDAPWINGHDGNGESIQGLW